MATPHPKDAAKSYVLGVRRGRRPNTDKAPSDFAEHAQREGNLKLRKRYSVRGTRIDAWRKETGCYFVKPIACKSVVIAAPVRAFKRVIESDMPEWLEADDDISALGVATWSRDEW